MGGREIAESLKMKFVFSLQSAVIDFESSDNSRLKKDVFEWREREKIKWIKRKQVGNIAQTSRPERVASPDGQLTAEASTSSFVMDRQCLTLQV